MPVDLCERLVIGVASSALFDLSDSDEVFRTQGAEAYEEYQRANQKNPLEPGVAFPFIARLLGLNQLKPDLVEVVVMSRNSPTSGLRVMSSIDHHGLPITRAVFRSGLGATDYMPVFNMSLFLSGNRADVEAAIQAGRPAGHVLPGSPRLGEEGSALRLAFDFDAVLADDSSERKFHEGTLDAYFEYERAHAHEPLLPGPLGSFLAGINRIQQMEDELADADASYKRRVRVSLVTARNAPAHERAVLSLHKWGVKVDDAFFLGGVSKTGVLNTLKPHIFFDDQLRHLEDPELTAPAVHVPFGVHNLPEPPTTEVSQSDEES